MTRNIVLAFTVALASFIAASIASAQTPPQHPRTNHVAHTTPPAARPRTTSRVTTPAAHATTPAAHATH